LKKWRSIVKNIAPTIATALGGPIAGGATPEDLYKMRELDNDFSIKMAEMDIDVYRMDSEDRISARNMAKTNMVPQIVLTIVFIGGYFGVIFTLFSGVMVITDSIKDMAHILLGILTANVPTIMHFWFGSSDGSKRKTEHLEGRA